MKIPKEYISDKLKESTVVKISKAAGSIKNNVENGCKIWEIKRKLKKKEQNPHRILNSHCQELENKDKTLRVCNVL